MHVHVLLRFFFSLIDFSSHLIDEAKNFKISGDYMYNVKCPYSNIYVLKYRRLFVIRKSHINTTKNSRYGIQYCTKIYSNILINAFISINQGRIPGEYVWSVCLLQNVIRLRTKNIQICQSQVWCLSGIGQTPGEIWLGEGRLPSIRSAISKPSCYTSFIVLQCLITDYRLQGTYIRKTTINYNNNL